jgi:alkylation response protein AidB-like acyl-CoA dehydrogenase
LAEGDAARVAHERAVDEWMALTGAALVGVAARALEIGVAYVKERKAWGVPIGTFQAISHRLADSASAIDGARLLAYEAAWAADDQPERAAELAAMSFAFAYETARDTTYWSLHFHGGYGFMMEYDIQLYYRRARGWANVFTDPELVYRRVADHRYGAVGATSEG